MKLTIEQMQQIIDNAPKGYYINSSVGISHVNGRLHIEMGIQDSSEYGNASSLSDLRKELEQSKSQVTDEAIEASKKQANIAQAVSKLRGEFPRGGCNSIYCSVEPIVFCTIEDFNQCVTELAEAAWMNKFALGEPQSYKAYKLYWSDTLIADEFEAHKINDAIVKEVQLCDEWDGSGFPPDQIEALVFHGDEWVSSLIIGMGITGCIYQIVDTLELNGDANEGNFKPQLTSEQKASREREEKAIELCKVRCESFGHRYNWDTLGEKKKEGYRKMIDAGVKLPE